MIKIRQVKILVTEDSEEKHYLKISKLLHIKKEDILKIEIKKKSIDARDKEIYFIYEFDVLVKNENPVLKENKSKDILLSSDTKFVCKKSGEKELKDRIIIVGMGPSGLFAAYLLACKGYKPLIIERGKKVSERIKDVEYFWKTGILNEESNVAFGEGGAGTFSDGKLNTLIKDKRQIGKYVFDILHENGANKEILYIQNPHIGTDNLRNILKNMREKILAMGAEIRYETKLTNIIVKNKQLEKIEVNNNELIPCSNLILAIGHSARDTLEMLLNHEVTMVSKPFAVGIRVMHSQDMINRNQYHKYADLLPNASYKLTYTTKEKRGVYSFCMCPGGYVVNSSCEKNHLVINGMSNYKRDTATANSAIVVTVNSKDYGEGVLAGVEFQRELEHKAYLLSNGKIPLQLWKDFKENKKSTKLGNIKAITKGDYELANLREFLPEFLVKSLLETMPEFDKKIPGFAANDTILAAIESRTSSGIKILRDENFEANIKGIFPTGEGAGYAGGITTSAIDGIKVAEEIISRYKKNSI